MREVEVNGHKYRIDKLNAFEQWHVVRRLTPLLTALGQGMAGQPLPQVPKAGDNAMAFRDMMTVVAPFAKALGEMSDVDSEYVIKTCLSVCHRQEAAGWQRVLEPRTRQIQFMDIEMPDMIQLTWEALRENLERFFATPPSSSPPLSPPAQA